MMRLRAGISTALLAATGCIVGVVAHGQTPAPDPSSVGQLGSLLWRGWSVTILTEGGWDDNVRFEQPDGAGDRMTGGSIMIDDGLRDARGWLTFRASGAVKRYRTLTDLNRVAYEATLAGRRAFTPRLDGMGDVTYRSTLSTELPRFSADAGTGALATDDTGGDPSASTVDRTATVLAPLTVARTLAASAAGSYLLTRHAAGVLTIGYANTQFEASTMLPATALTGSAQLARFFGHGALLVRGAALHGISQGRRLDTQSLAAGMESVWGAVTARLFAGATRMDTVGTAAIAPTGSAELAAVVGRGSTALRYTRSAGLAAGLGRLLLSHEAGARYDFRAREGTSAILDGSRSWNTDPAISNQELVTTTVTGGVRHAFRSGMVVEGSVVHRRREQGVHLSGTGVRLGLGYRFGAP